MCSPGPDPTVPGLFLVLYISLLQSCLAMKLLRPNHSFSCIRQPPPVLFSHTFFPFLLWTLHLYSTRNLDLPTPSTIFVSPIFPISTSTSSRVSYIAAHLGSYISLPPQRLLLFTPPATIHGNQQTTGSVCWRQYGGPGGRVWL